jgi:hypothetical protein
VSFEEGQSRKIVEDGPTMNVVVTFDCAGWDVGVGVLEGFGDASAPLPFLLPSNHFDENAPPTPPPTAAATTISASSNINQNVLFRSPRIVLSPSDSCAAIADVYFGVSKLGCVYGSGASLRVILGFRARALRARYRSSHAEHQIGQHRNEAVEPHTVDIITGFLSGVVNKALRSICTI